MYKSRIHPHCEQTKCWCGDMSASKCRLLSAVSTVAASPLSAICFKFRYTVPKLMSGNSRFTCVYTHSASGCVFVPHNTAYMISLCLEYRTVLSDKRVVFPRPVPQTIAFISLLYSNDYHYYIYYTTIQTKSQAKNPQKTNIFCGRYTAAGRAAYNETWGFPQKKQKRGTKECVV